MAASKLFLSAAEAYFSLDTASAPLVGADYCCQDVYQGGDPLPRHPRPLFGCFLTRFISPRPSPRGPGKGVPFTQMEVLASPVGNFPKFFTCQTRIRCGSYVLFRFFWVPSPPLQKLSPEVDPTPVSWPWQDFLEDSTPKRSYILICTVPTSVAVTVPINLVTFLPPPTSTSAMAPQHQPGRLCPPFRVKYSYRNWNFHI